MIITMIIDFLVEILKIIISWLAEVTPNIDIATYMLEYTAKIITITTQANNFIHFIVGDFIIVLVPAVIGLLGFKYVMYPIITLIRSVFVNGNN